MKTLFVSALLALICTDAISANAPQPAAGCMGCHMQDASPVPPKQLPTKDRATS